MTDEETLLKKIHDAVEEVIKNEKYDGPIVWFFSTMLESGLELYSGNSCAVCAVGRAMRWIEDNQVPHLDEAIKEETVNQKVH